MNLEEPTPIYVHTCFRSPEKSKSKSFHEGFLRKGGKFKSIEWIIIYLSKNCRFSWSKKRPSWNDFGFDFFGLPQHVGTWIGVHFGRFISKLLIPIRARGGEEIYHENTVCVKKSPKIGAKCWRPPIPQYSKQYKKYSIQTRKITKCDIEQKF